MIRTMIIEDDPMVLQINERFLSEVDGFDHVGSVSHIEDAKEQIQEVKPDLLLLDVFFATGKGTDVIQWLRSENIDTDVIFITADRTPETIERAFRFGAVDYLIKPFRFDRFEEALVKYHQKRALYAGTEQLDQTEIDALRRGRSGSVEEESSHLDHEQNQTRQLILRLLRKHPEEGYTAQRVADELGISRITARRYLDELESEAVLELHLVYGKIGRPRNQYRITSIRKEVEG